MDRRLFLLATGGLSLSPFAPQNPSETEPAKDVTRTLARYIVSAKTGDPAIPVNFRITSRSRWSKIRVLRPVRSTSLRTDAVAPPP